MRNQKEIEAFTYGLWYTITKQDSSAVAVMLGVPMLDLVLWILDQNPDDRTNENFDHCLKQATRGLQEDAIEDPIGIIKRDLASRKEAKQKAAHAINN